MNVVFMAAEISYSDLEIASFLKVTRSFMLIIRNKLVTFSSSVSSVAKIKRPDIIKMAGFDQQSVKIMNNNFTGAFSCAEYHGQALAQGIGSKVVRCISEDSSLSHMRIHGHHS